MRTWPAELCTQPSPIPRSLAGPELYEWMALRRADAGGMVWFEDRYYDGGRRVPCFLPSVFDELIETGLLMLADPNPDWPGRHRAVLTAEGRARFAVLSERDNPRAVVTDGSPAPVTGRTA
jgi:hypothetical protein